MPDYHATSGADVINQTTLGLPTSTIIYGDAGDDAITLVTGNADGGAGNDTITGTGVFATAAYFDSPGGIDANLASGVVRDGFGGVDKLVGIHTVAGSRFNDTLTGGSTAENFIGSGGSDRIVGGGGADTFFYFSRLSTNATVTYDAPTDTFTVRKAFPGDSGVDTLVGVSSIQFAGTGSDDTVYTRASFVGDFISSPSVIRYAMTAGAYTDSIRVGDFNGDGVSDLVLVGQIQSGTAPSATLFMLGDGKGGFTDATARLVVGGSLSYVHGGGRTLVADFNSDGVSDVLQLDFGNDAPPYAGGVTKLILSSGPNHQLVYATSNIDAWTGNNHAGGVGDLNGDGAPDAVIAETSPQGNRLLINDGTGHLNLIGGGLPAPVLNGAPNSDGSAAIVDVNLDGRLDVILGRWDGEVSAPASVVLLNPGSGGFASTAGLALPASGLARETVLDIQPIDLNGDALPDLILSVTIGGDDHSAASYYTTPYIQFLVNDGGGRFHDETALRLPQPLAQQTGWYKALTVVDFNGDGHPDILASTGNENAPSVVYMNRGDGVFVRGQSFDGKAVALDVNGDGRPDIVSASTTLNYLTVSLNRFAPVAASGAPTAGGDNLVAGAGLLEIHAGTGNDTILGAQLSDYLRGDEGDDSIQGGSGFDDANGNMGNDTISTGAGDDYCVGGKDNDSLSGGADYDLVYGNLGNDTCDGGAGNDIVRGGQDNDLVRGGAGNDFVSGDKGDDTMTGGAGADLFHTFGDAGLDRVTDFNLGEGDRVQLDPGTVFTVSQVGADTVIAMTGGGQMILVGVQMSTLTPGWIFGA